MNINAKNLIRLRALSPRNSVNVKIENVNVVEREKTHIQSRVKRFRENKKGGWKPTHIIELQGRVICVYGLESNNKTEYAVTCGGVKEAKELWYELFSEYVVEYPKEIDKKSTKPDDKFEVILPAEIVNEEDFIMSIKSLLYDYKKLIILIREKPDKMVFVSDINISFIDGYEYGDEPTPEVHYKAIGSISIMKNGVIKFSNNLYNDIYLFTKFLGNPNEAIEYLLNKFEGCITNPNKICSAATSLGLNSIYNKL